MLNNKNYKYEKNYDNRILLNILIHLGNENIINKFVNFIKIKDF